MRLQKLGVTAKQWEAELERRVRALTLPIRNVG